MNLRGVGWWVCVFKEARSKRGEGYENCGRLIAIMGLAWRFFNDWGWNMHCVALVPEDGGFLDLVLAWLLVDMNIDYAIATILS